MVQCKRIYLAAAADDGQRVLVDRLWPRGISKEAAQLDAWVAEVAPSDELRRAFHRDGDFQAFRLAYRQQLDAQPQHWQALLHSATTGTLTLLYAARDEAHNNARVLAEYLEDELQRTGEPSSPVCYQGEFGID
ncbi:DUF488 family protein [Pseudomonas sp. GOM7]|uniref:DUF488 domain-containing protein n=1 Tax=Pseudomonas sp. GOM7 TaxID=2998079 RepID=UPI00227B1022|nr:DUF488 family protein [Pseudomonas sp. GOM7]WAJ39071.1 DUF488 family protein [Pseudomonas sp. GOM7]